jgi:hypothetical protein
MITKNLNDMIYNPPKREGSLVLVATPDYAHVALTGDRGRIWGRE